MKIKFIQALILALGFTVFSKNLINAQVVKIWEKPTSSSILWQNVTSLGNLIVCTNKALEGVNTENGNIEWSIEYLNAISDKAFEEIPGSPYFKVELEERFLLVNQFDGQIAFDSNSKGIIDISSFYILSKSGTFLVSGQTQNKSPLVLSVDLSDASENWRIEDEFRLIVAVEELSSNELLLVSISEVRQLESKTGNVVWKSSIDKATDEQLEKLGGFGDLLKDMAEEVVEKDIDDFKINFFRSPDKDLYIVGAESKLEDAEDSFDGKDKYETTYNAYRKSDGSELWIENVQVGRKKFKEMARTIELDGKMGNLLYLESGFLILSNNNPMSNINLYDYETGKGKWGKAGYYKDGNHVGIDIRGSIYEYLETNNGVLLATNERGNHYLTSIDPETGALKFKKPTKVEGSVIGIVPMDNDVMYLTDQSINILNLDSGDLKWKKGISTTPELSNEKEDKIYIFDTRSNIIKVLDKQTKNLSELSNNQLVFQGNESPNKLELMDDGILLHSSQNIAKYDYNGTILFNKYYAAPKESGFIRGLNIAGGLFLAFVAADSYYTAGKLGQAKGSISAENKETIKFVGQLEDAYSDHGDDASDAMKSCFSVLKNRKKATQSAKTYNFIMTKKDKNIVLLKVSKITGEVDGEIILGRDREPVYAIDEVSGQVYYLESGKSLVAYKVN